MVNIIELILYSEIMSNSICDGDGFVTVSKRKSARKSKITHQQIVIEGTDSNPGICSTASIRNIFNSRKEIQTSDFFKNFLAVLIQSSDKINKPIADIVCFGIGCISSSKISQYQLALLLNLSENFECSIEVYDPIFTEVDKQILVDLKLNLLPSNCEGKKKQNSAGATLFFLPHCPRELSNNLLYANWDSGLLQNCIIYANSFEKVIINTPRRLKKDEVKEDKEDVNGIPSFWSTIFKNVEMLAEMVQEADEPVLDCLEDITVTLTEKAPMGFTLHFHFKENEYITVTLTEKAPMGFTLHFHFK